MSRRIARLSSELKTSGRAGRAQIDAVKPLVQAGKGDRSTSGQGKDTSGRYIRLNMMTGNQTNPTGPVPVSKWPNSSRKVRVESA